MHKFESTVHLPKDCVAALSSSSHQLASLESNFVGLPILGTSTILGNEFGSNVVPDPPDNLVIATLSGTVGAEEQRKNIGNVETAGLEAHTTVRNIGHDDGIVYGHATDTTADFRVDFPGLVPTVAVTLRRDSASSFSMQARVWGEVLMDVTFDRIVKP